MKVIEQLIIEKKISRINELELPRYTNFLENAHKDNLEHCKYNLKQFPRWSIISGYYAMHDITKLFLAKKFRIKIDYEVHSSTIKALEDVINDRELLGLMQNAYEEFKSMASDLNEAKTERTKAQYYTGTDFMKREFERKSGLFLITIVLPYMEKMKILLGENYD